MNTKKVRFDDILEFIPNTHTKSRPTTQTPINCPNLQPSNLPASCEQSSKRITEQQAHQYLDFCTLWDFKILNETGNRNAKIINNSSISLELSKIANLHCSCWSNTPIPRPSHFLSAVHMDIGYGNCVTIGGLRYTIMLVDCATRFRWIYGLKSLTHNHIIAALELFCSKAGMIPETFYTDFDPKLIKGKTADWIRQANSKVIAAPSACQDKNGLVEWNWNVEVNMAHTFLTNAQMPWNFWFHAIQHATRICNIFPCKVDGELTTEFELAYRIKLDYQVNKTCHTHLI